MHRSEGRFRWPRHAEHLANDAVDSSHLARYDVSEVGRLVFVDEDIGKGAHRNHRVFDFVGHAGGERQPSVTVLPPFTLPSYTLSKSSAYIVGARNTTEVCCVNGPITALPLSV